MVLQCSWCLTEELACGHNGNGSALEACSRRCAIQTHVTLLYFYGCDVVQITQMLVFSSKNINTTIQRRQRRLVSNTYPHVLCLLSLSALNCAQVRRSGNCQSPVAHRQLTLRSPCSVVYQRALHTISCGLCDFN